jgi:hypothetical protein
MTVTLADHLATFYAFHPYQLSKTNDFMALVAQDD